MNNLITAIMNGLTHEASEATFRATIPCLHTKHTCLFYPPNRCLIMLRGFIKRNPEHSTAGTAELSGI